METGDSLKNLSGQLAWGTHLSSRNKRKHASGKSKARTVSPKLFSNHTCAVACSYAQKHNTVKINKFVKIKEETNFEGHCDGENEINRRAFTYGEVHCVGELRKLKTKCVWMLVCSRTHAYCRCRVPLPRHHLLKKKKIDPRPETLLSQFVELPWHC